MSNSDPLPCTRDTTTNYKQGYYYQRVFGYKTNSDNASTLSSSSSSSSSCHDSASVSAPNQPPTMTAGGSRDWNSEFQSIVDALNATQHDGTDDDPSNANLAANANSDARNGTILGWYSKLSRLAKDFVYVAKEYGKIIIMERDLPIDQKTIKPVDLGGVAGGYKYIHAGILFKFSIDRFGLYGSDELAMKAAGHELKSVREVFESGSASIHVPLMTLLDYRGYRLVAMSILPLSDLIIYGSRDGGKTVHASDPSFNESMRLLARHLNLKRHLAGSLTAGSQQYIHAPADIEGHKGTDGRYYLLDFARLFPPEHSSAASTATATATATAPTTASTVSSRSPSSSYLHNLLRPELVRKYDVPLSSDACSSFGKHDPECTEHNNQVQEASHYMRTHLVMRVAQSLEHITTNTKLSGRVSGARIVDTLHRHGVNVRHMGLVRSHVHIAHLRTTLLLEMVARVAKGILNSRLRSTMLGVRMNLQEPYKETVTDFFNQLVRATVAARTNTTANLPEFTVMLINEITYKFGPNALTPDERRVGVLAQLDPLEMLSRMQALTGVRLADKSLEEFGAMIQMLKHNSTSSPSTLSSSVEAPTPTTSTITATSSSIPITTTAAGALPEGFEFVVQDVERISCRVKDMNIVSFAEAAQLFLHSMRANGVQSDRLFTMAMAKFEATQAAAPDDDGALLDWANALLARASSKHGEERTRLVKQAIERVHATHNVHCTHELAQLLHRQALSEPSSEERERLFVLASENYKYACTLLSRQAPPQHSLALPLRQVSPINSSSPLRSPPSLASFDSEDLSSSTITNSLSQPSRRRSRLWWVFTGSSMNSATSMNTRLTGDGIMKIRTNKTDNCYSSGSSNSKFLQVKIDHPQSSSVRPALATLSQDQVNRLNNSNDVNTATSMASPSLPLVSMAICDRTARLSSDKPALTTSDKRDGAANRRLLINAHSEATPVTTQARDISPQSQSQHAVVTMYLEWGSLLYDQAKLKSGSAAVSGYKCAGKKYLKGFKLHQQYHSRRSAKMNSSTGGHDNENAEQDDGSDDGNEGGFLPSQWDRLMHPLLIQCVEEEAMLDIATLVKLTQVHSSQQHLTASSSSGVIDIDAQHFPSLTDSFLAKLATAFTTASTTTTTILPPPSSPRQPKIVSPRPIQGINAETEREHADVEDDDNDAANVVASVVTDVTMLDVVSPLTISTLKLADSLVSDAAFIFHAQGGLQGGFRNLLHLDVRDCKAITELTLVFLSRSSPHLRYLNVSGSMIGRTSSLLLLSATTTNAQTQGDDARGNHGNGNSSQTIATTSSSSSSLASSPTKRSRDQSMVAHPLPLKARDSARGGLSPVHLQYDTTGYEKKKTPRTFSTTIAAASSNTTTVSRQATQPTPASPTKKPLSSAPANGASTASSASTSTSTSSLSTTPMMRGTPTTSTARRGLFPASTSSSSSTSTPPPPPLTTTLTPTSGTVALLPTQSQSPEMVPLVELETLHMSDCPELGDDSLLRILTNCPNLTELNLSGSTAFSHSGLINALRIVPIPTITAATTTTTTTTTTAGSSSSLPPRTKGFGVAASVPHGPVNVNPPPSLSRTGTPISSVKATSNANANMATTNTSSRLPPSRLLVNSRGQVQPLPSSSPANNSVVAGRKPSPMTPATTTTTTTVPISRLNDVPLSPSQRIFPLEFSIHPGDTLVSVNTSPFSSPSATPPNMLDLDALDPLDPLPVDEVRPTRIKTLDITRCAQLRDQAILYLVASCSNTLETIRLGGLPRLSRSAIRIIGLHCSRLRQIKLGRFPTMDDDTVQLLAQRCPLLEQFEVSHVTNATFTNASLVYLAKACSNLTTVGVSHCKQVGDVAIQELANRCWRSLRNLKLAGLYKLTNASIEAVAAKCASLVVLELDGCENVSDSAITALAQGCPDLRVLTLRSLKLTTTCLVQVLQSQQLSQLQRLNMARLNAQVTDHVIGALAANCRAARRSSSLLLNTGPQSTSSSSGPGAAASLTQLNLSWCSRFSSTAFKNLAAAMGTALRSIDLTECKLTDDTIIALAESCPQLEVAILDACPKITDTSVIKLAGSCGASLRTLSLSGCYRVTDPGIGKLSRCAPQLRYLDLSWCYKLTNSSIVQLFRDAPRMQTLLLNGCRQLTDSAIDELIHRPDLQPALSRLDLECVTLVTRPTLWKLRTARPHLNVSTKGS